MFGFLKRFFRRERDDDYAPARPAAPVKRKPAKAAKPPAAAASSGEPEVVLADPDDEGHIETVGPGKNVLIRNKYVREETGTYETLKIVDDSLVDTGEETGIDPYNTGDFDRSKNWDKRFR